MIITGYEIVNPVTDQSSHAMLYALNMEQDATEIENIVGVINLFPFADDDKMNT